MSSSRKVNASVPKASSSHAPAKMTARRRQKGTIRKSINATLRKLLRHEKRDDLKVNQRAVTNQNALGTIWISSDGTEYEIPPEDRFFDDSCGLVAFLHLFTRVWDSEEGRLSGPELEDVEQWLELIHESVKAEASGMMDDALSPSVTHHAADAVQDEEELDSAEMQRTSPRVRRDYTSSEDSEGDAGVRAESPNVDMLESSPVPTPEEDEDSREARRKALAGGVPKALELTGAQSAETSQRKSVGSRWEIFDVVLARCVGGLDAASTLEHWPAVIVELLENKKKGSRGQELYCVELIPRREMHRVAGDALQPFPTRTLPRPYRFWSDAQKKVFERGCSIASNPVELEEWLETCYREHHEVQDSEEL